MRSYNESSNKCEDNKLLLINMATKINQRIIERNEDIDEINEDKIIEEFNGLLENEHQIDRLISTGNTIYSESDLKEFMDDNQAQKEVTSMVKDYLIKTDRL